ncbi:MAG: helix-turn-helix domain-containing protein [Peptococcaceae bacterium]|nr:helix-turn-helix domain-containing protein [Peptococcaceae bacterium]
MVACKCSYELPEEAKYCPQCGRKAPKQKAHQQPLNLTEMSPVLTATEAAKLLKCSKWMIYELAKQDRVPHFHIGNRVRFPTNALMTWAEIQCAITTAGD